jgi:hypothetical protein
LFEDSVILSESNRKGNLESGRTTYNKSISRNEYLICIQYRYLNSQKKKNTHTYLYNNKGYQARAAVIAASLSLKFQNNIRGRLQIRMSTNSS